jgi:hypothetical protein
LNGHFVSRAFPASEDETETGLSPESLPRARPASRSGKPTRPAALLRAGPDMAAIDFWAVVISPYRIQP